MDTWFWALVIIGAVWLISRRGSSAQITPTGHSAAEHEAPSETISEEGVLSQQTSFEEKLEHTFLPDAILFKSLYVYRHMMRIWFARLSGRYRYDDSMIQKLRRDWVNYMTALADAHTYHFLFIESFDGNKEEKQKLEAYDERSANARRKATAIEDGFAAAMGKEAVDELARIRSLDLSSFSIEGELAPDGMEFDLKGNLRKKKVTGTKRDPKATVSNTSDDWFIQEGPEAEAGADVVFVPRMK